VQLELVVQDRKNMLRDVTQAIADANTNVRGAEMYAKDTTAVGRFVVEVSNLTHLNRIIDKVKTIKGVISVRRAKRSETVE
jgi:GTP pyrophosphokinase